MLVGDADIRPDFSIYYWASKFLSFAKTDKLNQRPFLIYNKFKKKSKLQIGYDNFAFILDFLFIIEYIKLDKQGNIIKCS